VLETFRGKHAKLRGHRGQNEDGGVNCGKWNIQLFDPGRPQLGGGAAKGEVDGEQAREEHDLAAKPDDGPNGYGVGPIDCRGQAGSR
jgi:hypothetical protein